MSHHFVQRLIDGLLNHSSGRDRYSCAVELMKVQEPEVEHAYLQALNDSCEEVVQVACFQLSHRGGRNAIEALYHVLEHRSWHVRLEACKALIVLEAVDQRVLSTLEQMAYEPEAFEHDAEHAELEQLLHSLALPDELRELWGNLDTILERARRIAAQRELTASAEV